jgi:hypothetical protein
MVMVCIQVLSEDSTIAFTGSQGNFELAHPARTFVLIPGAKLSRIILRRGSGHSPLTFGANRQDL